MQNWSNYNAFKAANNNPKNWSSGEVGVNTQIGSVAFTARKTISGRKAPSSIKMVRSNSLRRDGKEDQRFRRVLGGGNVNASAKGIGKGFGILAALDLGYSVYEAYGSTADYFSFDSNQKSLKFALTDLTNYISEGLLDPDYFNTVDLSNLLNIIFQGESQSNNPNIQKIGLAIYNRYQETSYKRRQYNKQLIKHAEEGIERSNSKNYQNYLAN